MGSGYLDAMRLSKSLPMILFSISVFILAACSGAPTRPGFNGPPLDGPGNVEASETATSMPIAVVPTETSVISDNTPIPTQDLIGLLVTQAYAGVTPNATEPAPTSTPVTSSNIQANYVGLTPTATLEAAPAAVIVSQPIQIANAVNTVDCKIRKVGDCTPMIAKDNTFFLTWSFGVEGAQSFQWGQAAVVVTRNGDPYSWTLTSDVYLPTPDASKNEKWLLNVGQTAQLSGSVDNAQPGYYTAKLMMCLLTPNECNAGQGWQDVGGDTVNFVVQ
jgi:hypothetical protein